MLPGAGRGSCGSVGRRIGSDAGGFGIESQTGWVGGPWRDYLEGLLKELPGGITWRDYLEGLPRGITKVHDKPVEGLPTLQSRASGLRSTAQGIPSGPKKTSPSPPPKQILPGAGPRATRILWSESGAASRVKASDAASCRAPPLRGIVQGFPRIRCIHYSNEMPCSSNVVVFVLSLVV